MIEIFLGDLYEDGELELSQLEEIIINGSYRKDWIYNIKEGTLIAKHKQQKEQQKEKEKLKKEKRREELHKQYINYQKPIVTRSKKSNTNDLKKVYHVEGYLLKKRKFNTLFGTQYYANLTVDCWGCSYHNIQLVRKKWCV